MPIPECEKLIRRMLHLDPSKRITMASVLKHRWMQGPESDPPSPTQNHLHVRVFGSSDNLLWNEQVLRAIQRMNYNVEACKQVRYTQYHAYICMCMCFLAYVEKVPPACVMSSRK